MTVCFVVVAVDVLNITAVVVKVNLVSVLIKLSDRYDLNQINYLSWQGKWR